MPSRYNKNALAEYPYAHVNIYLYYFEYLFHAYFRRTFSWQPQLYALNTTSTHLLITLDNIDVGPRSHLSKV